MNGNTSASGGFLLPSDAPAPLEGADLEDFLHDLIVGVTGLDPTLVRPAWNPEPVNIPDASVRAWAAFRIERRTGDTFPEHGFDNIGAYVLTIQEEIDVLVSFYGKGSTSDADKYATILRDGMAIDQNDEFLLGGNMGLVGVGQIVPLPTLLNEIWFYRADLPFTIRREIVRKYPVLTLLEANGTLLADAEGTKITETFDTDNQPRNNP